MKISPRICSALSIALVMFAGTAPFSAADEQPPRAIVLADNAPALEKLAARELQAQIQQLWKTDVPVAARPQDLPGAEIWIGSPRTNPAIQAALGNQWPQVSDQGIVLHSVSTKNGTALVVGGGSPVATLWAVYELGYQWGIRYLLAGDVYPEEQPKCRLADWNYVGEPNLRARSWRTINDFPIGPEAWGLAEHQRVLRQLAKQKFNRLMLSIYPWQPFMHYEFRGVKKQSALLWFGAQFPIDGDTPGRAVFKGSKEFYNPDLAGKKNYDELTQAGVQLIQGVIDEAHRLGMTVGISFSPLEFPQEFAPSLPGSKVVNQLGSLTIGPGANQPPHDPLLLELATAQLRSFLTTYPTVDAIYVTLPEHPDWDEHTETSWMRLSQQAGLDSSISLKNLEQAAANRTTIASGKRGVKSVRSNITALDFLRNWLADEKRFQRPDGKSLEVYVSDLDPALYPYLDRLLPPQTGGLHFIDYTARRVADHANYLHDLKLPAADSASRPADPSLILTLADDNVGILPQLATKHIAQLTNQLRKSHWSGFSTRYWIAGDLEPTVHFLSRSSYDETITPDQAVQELVLPNCGAGVAERLILGWNQIAQATDVIDQHDLGFAFPVPDLVMKHYAATEPPPAWWQTATSHYEAGMNEMYRAHDRATPAGRRLLYSLARRYEFGLEYMTAMTAVRNAGVAKSKHDSATQLAQLEAAVESLYNGLTALSTVAADDSCYRGVIAVVTEYGYRPLLKEVETLQDAIEAEK